MQKRKFTVVTQLHEVNNKDIIKYFEATHSEYAKIVRVAFHHIKRNPSFNKSAYNTYLQQEYNISKRTATSIITAAQGRIKALVGLKKHEREMLTQKITWFENTLIPELEKQRITNSGFMQRGGKVNVQKQRNLRRMLVAKKNKLNQMKQQLDSLNYQLETGAVKLCFGSRRLFKRNYNAFIEQRDNQMSFVGCKLEPAGNLMVQLTYNKQNNQFNIKLRKDFKAFKQSQGADRYAFGKVYFNHHKNHIINILKNKNSPLFYRIIRKNNRYYLYCTFEIQQKTSNSRTCSDSGVIGLDFNKGFATLVETNQYGHITQTKVLPYRFKQGNATRNDLQKLALKATLLASHAGKDMVVENLNFKRSKAQVTKGRGKEYNAMLHSLAYRQFLEAIESATYRENIGLIKVNPAWTSWEASREYCPVVKLNIHTGAAFVIAKRGQKIQSQHRATLDN